MDFAINSHQCLRQGASFGSQQIPIALRKRIQTRCIATLSSETVFKCATVFAIPLYAFMIVTPKSKLTRNIILSEHVVVAVAVTYAALLLLWSPWRLIAEVCCKVLSSSILPDVSAFGKLFKCPSATSIAWLHLLLLDFYQARWICADAIDRSIPAAHSLILCFMVGPLGLLSHLITSLTIRSRRKKNIKI